MRRKIGTSKGIRVNVSYEAEPNEITLRRAMSSNEPIATTAPIIYTERKDGVSPEYDIRTDRFEIAQELTTIAAKKDFARREEKKEKVEAQGPSGTETETN